MGSRVCLVGGGASGVAMAKAMVQRGLAFDWFERSSQLGGLWSTGQGADRCGAAYSSLHINSSKQRMEFSDFPMPDEYPDFPSQREIADYLAAYAAHFGVTERVALGCEVTSVGKSGVGSWAVRTGDGKERLYDVVLTASGYHSVPKYPERAAEGFEGEVLHSHHVRDAATFAGRRVLVIGLGNSAVDIASLISTTAARTYISTRRVTHIVPKYLFGRPFDELPAPPWPRSLRWAWYGLAVRLAAGPLERYGLPAPSHDFGRGAVTISSDLLHRIAHGTIQPRPAVSVLHADTISFEDGREEEVDTIVFCTGYTHSVPFLERGGFDPGKIDYRLFEQIWDPRFQGLAHVGLVQPLGSLFPIVEAQSELLADWIAGKYALPRSSVMSDAIRRDQRRRERYYVESDRHLLQVDEPGYSNRLRREHRRGIRRAGKQRPAADRVPEPAERPPGATKLAI
jgi:dimethylaniline monooxygenase (N-oxide forming)